MTRSTGRGQARSWRSWSPCPRCPARPSRPTSRRTGSPLHDPRSGLHVAPGTLVGLVSADPDESAPGRPAARPAGARRRQDLVTLGGTRLADLPLATVRRRVLVSEAEPRLFTGALRDELDPWGGAGRRRRLLGGAATSPRRTTSSTRCPRGWTPRSTRRGRGFLRRPAAAARPGPRRARRQRRPGARRADQRGRRAHRGAGRAPAAGGAARRRPAADDARTTVVTSASPLLLDRCDEVAFLVARPGRRHRHPPRPARPAPGLPRDRHPGGGLMRSTPPLRRRRTSTTLPVATAAQVREQAAVLLAGHRRPLVWMLVLNALAALAGLAGPRLLGRIVQSVQHGTTTSHIDQLAMLLAGALLLQTVFTWFARRSAFVLAETVFAQLRERYLEKVLSLPLSTVERAGTGDLVTRSTGDVEALARTVRFAVPEVLVAVADGGPDGGRGVLHRTADGAAPAGRRADHLRGHPVVPAPGTGGLPRRARVLRGVQRHARGDRRRRPHRRGARARRPPDPPARGGPRGRLRRRALHAAAAHLLLPEHGARLRDPDLGAPALGRPGWCPTAGPPSARSPPSRCTPSRSSTRSTGWSPGWTRSRSAPPPWPASSASSWCRRDRASRRGGAGRRARRGARRPVRLPRAAATCCTASTSTCARASGSPWSGRPAPASRPSAGCSPASTRRAPARSPSATCRWSSCRWTTCASTSCWSPRSTTSSSAPSPRTSCWPARTPTSGDLRAALDAVDALAWVLALPDGLATEVGSGGRPITPAQAQQLALARLVLADPHTLVLDEATSLLDPRAARHLERSLAAVLHGPHRGRDRAPAAHGARRRPGGRGRGRPDQRAGQPRRADRRPAAPTPRCGTPGGPTNPSSSRAEATVGGGR